MYSEQSYFCKNSLTVLKSILLLLMMNILSSVFAQEASVTLKVLKPNQIFVGKQGFTQNNKIYPFSDLDERLINNPSAYQEYNKYKSLKKSSQIPMIFWLAGIVGGFASLNNNNNLSGKLLAVSFVPIFISIHLDGKANKHLNKALSIYNSQF